MRQRDRPENLIVDELPDPTADTLSDWSAFPGASRLVREHGRRFQTFGRPGCSTHNIHPAGGMARRTGRHPTAALTASGAEGVEVEVEPFRSDTYTLPGDAAQARFVRYVLSDEFGNKCGYHDPAIYPPHLVPDMLDDIDVFDLKARNVRPVWITVSGPGRHPRR